MFIGFLATRYKSSNHSLSISGIEIKAKTARYDENFDKCLVPGSGHWYQSTGNQFVLILLLLVKSLLYDMVDSLHEELLNIADVLFQVCSNDYVNYLVNDFAYVEFRRWKFLVITDFWLSKFWLDHVSKC